MAGNHINIAVIGGTKAEFAQLSALLDLSEETYHFSLIKNKAKFLEVINNGDCQLIIGDPNRKGFSVLATLDLIVEHSAHIPIIGVYEATELSVVDVMQKGFADYVEISNNQHLRLVVSRELCHIARTLRTSTNNSKDFTGLKGRQQFLQYLEKNLPIALSDDL